MVNLDTIQFYYGTYTGTLNLLGAWYTMVIVGNVFLC